MAESEERERREAEIRAAFEASRLASAAERLLAAYGAEIITFLRSLLRGPDEAADAFQIFCEEMWKSLPKFRGESSFRTWAYSIARHSAFRQLRSPHRRAGRAIPLSGAPEVAAMAEKIRTSTLKYLRSEVKERIAVLQESLEPEERALFVLRLNRKMSWPDIARVMDGASLPEAEVQKRAAALRKRFQRAKDRLRELVQRDGTLRTES